MQIPLQSSEVWKKRLENMAPLDRILVDNWLNLLRKELGGI